MLWVLQKLPRCCSISRSCLKTKVDTKTPWQNRAAAGRYLLENNSCDIVLSDDGLQHYKLQRDLELAIVDSSRKFGNGFCIPAGPLREPVSRLDNVDIVITHNTGSILDDDTSFELLFDNPVNIYTNETRTLDEFKSSKYH